MRHHRWHRRVTAAALACSPRSASPRAAATAAAPPTLTWYINPDSGGQAEIARRCTEAAGGRVHDRGGGAAARVAPSSASSSSAGWRPRTPRST